MTTNIDALKISTPPRKDFILLPADADNLAIAHEVYDEILGRKITDSRIIRRALALLGSHLSKLKDPAKRSAEIAAILTSGLPR